MLVRRFALSLGFALLGAILLVLENMPAQATSAVAMPVVAESLSQLPVMYE
jgi:hypothetical protein